MDRMDDVDNKDMHLASKFASSGRRKIHVGFYLKSDRFGDFSASEWFESILRPPELWNREKMLEKTRNINNFL